MVMSSFDRSFKARVNSKSATTWQVREAEGGTTEAAEPPAVGTPAGGSASPEEDVEVEQSSEVGTWGLIKRDARRTSCAAKRAERAGLDTGNEALNITTSNHTN